MARKPYKLTIDDVLKNIEQMPEDQVEDYLNDPANKDAKELYEKYKNGPVWGSPSLPIDDPFEEASPEALENSVDSDNVTASKAEDKTREESGFSYERTPYRESASVAAARAALAKLTAPDAYSSVWQQKLSEAAERILNREKFSYDYGSDPLYAAYRDQYMRQGKAAMEDTAGRISALTGGYASSYAAVAGNAAYRGYLDKLNDRMISLYEAALQRYDSETEALNGEYKLLRELENGDLADYKAKLSAYESERDALIKLLANEESADYKRYIDGQQLDLNAEKARADDSYKRDKAAAEIAYKKEKDAGEASEDPENASPETGLNEIKSAFLTLLRKNGQTAAFAYIEELISKGMSIGAVRQVLSECGMLDVYLAAKSSYLPGGDVLYAAE